eukprot:TRINITY_DN372_c0_g2_i1.p1 TRINITY_DN372_c0_g2~~TRINITY_DN372_c0_g2_i1.p1  ORF type:complete len:524 (+),score=206.53 TRINITY_DN372_c0_g2_i1:219-1790(+)
MGENEVEYLSNSKGNRTIYWIFIGIGIIGTLSGIGFLWKRKNDEEEERKNELERKEEEEKEIQLQILKRNELIKQQERDAKNLIKFNEFLRDQYGENESESKDSNTDVESDYPFDKRDTRDSIEYTIDNQGNITIKGGTIYKLIEKLTDEHGKGVVITGGFLLTYRSFTTPLELLQLLIKRYHTPVESNQDYRKHIRLRVWHVLKYWIENFFFDFEEEKQLLDQLVSFVNEEMVKDMGKTGVALSTLLEKKMTGKVDGKQVLLSNPPPPLLPSTTGKISLLDIHPQEIARQMTLIEYKLFEQIQPKECLDQSWNKDGNRRAPNIVALINRFNLTSRWITCEIVSEVDNSRRAQLITHFIAISNECRKLQNFNSMMGILSGLMGGPVSRLKNTWSNVPPEIVKMFEEEYSNLFSKNFKLMRDAVKQSNPPCLPYFGTYLADLTFIEDGNSNTIANGKLINFEKRLMISKVISELRIYQQRRFALCEVPSIRDFIEDSLQGKNVKFLTEDECHQQSLAREPRMKS